ncbi:MAG: diaminopropionate ammonia-lyase [Selenomonadaceae bacterium]
MAELYKAVENKCKKEKGCDLQEFNQMQAEKARRFHRSIPGYAPTPLQALDQLAKHIGVDQLLLKDESYRFGLNAFKVLGGSYAIANCIAARANEKLDDLSFAALVSDKILKKTGKLTFVTATDGNHGRGVAWTANQLQQKSVIYMPEGSEPERLENIRKEGAEASITELNYDDAVRLANDMAKEKGWIMVQDTAWKGYENIPRWIMQGYMTMALEVYEQLEEIKRQKPTHIFLQAGVGSYAGAVAGFFASAYGADCPIITIVESSAADCLYRTAKAADGKLHFVKGHMNTIMAGLACGEPNTISWEILRDYADCFVSCPDYMSANAMRVLGNPLTGDPHIISGESGAAGMGLVFEVMTDPQLSELKKQLRLDHNSRVLVFNTEGDTAKKHYRSIVWNGQCAKENEYADTRKNN